MRLRPILTVGCVLAVATATVATAAPKAAPKPPCKLLVDPAGDQAAGLEYDPSLDIVSADIANNATTLTAVIRVAKLTADDPMAPGGRYYDMTFNYRSNGLGSEPISAALTPTGNVFVGGAGTGVVDLAKNEIRISVPLSRLTGHPLLKPGDALEHINVRSDVTHPAVPDYGGSRPSFYVTLSQLGDTATTAKTYPVGTPNCVKVGA